MSLVSWKFVSSWLVFLTVLIPIAQAQTLSIQQASGKDGLRGFNRENDVVQLTALAQIPGDAAIIPSQLRITTQGINYLFSNCTQQSGDFFLCTFRQQVFGSRGQRGYSIQLVDDNGNVEATAGETMNADVLAPEISIGLEPGVTSTGSSVLNYLVQDYASQAGNTQVCAGNDRLQVWEGGVGQKLLSTVLLQQTCIESGQVRVNTTATGAVKYCLVATDRLNQSSTQCANLIVDKTGPSIRTSSLRVTDPDGNDVRFVRTDGVTADVSIEIAGNDTYVNSVRADLSKLTDEGANDAQPDEITGSEAKTYVWKNVLLNRVIPCQVVVKASDLVGNTAQQTINCNVQIDSSAPQVADIRTGATEGALPLIGANSTVSVQFREAQSGMGERNAFMDLSRVGLGGNTRADTCFRVGDVWQCNWRVSPRVASGDYVISVLGATSDDLGNIMLQKVDKNVRVDAQAPQDFRIASFSVIHGQAEYGNLTVKGDTVDYVLQAKGAARVTANMNDIGVNQTIVAQCNYQGNPDQCFVEQTVLRSGPYPATIAFTAVDNAGNSVGLSHQLFVFGVATDANPNFWSSTVDCSPSAIDRSTTTLINHKAYCHVKLKGAPDISTAGISLDRSLCTGDVDSFADISLMNAQAGSKDPYIALTLTAGDFTVNELRLSCPLQILSKVGTSFTQNPEKEDISMNLQFYNNPLGEFNSNLDEKISDAKDATEGFFAVIGVLRTIFGWGEKLCEIRTIIANTLASLDAVLASLEVLTGVGFFPVGAVTKETIFAPLCTQKEGLQGAITGPDGILSFMGTVCDVLNCKAAEVLEGEDGISAIGRAMGGGVLAGPWANSPIIKDTYNAQGAGGITRVNVKESLVWSVASLCVPGIIYNVDKMRQIQCRYAVCLADDVKNKGVSVSVCEDEKNYLWCNYGWSQGFAAIPWLPIFNYWLGVAQEIVAEPWRAISLIIGRICLPFCTGAPGYSACAIPKTLAIIGQTIQDVQTIKGENFFSVNNGWCQQLDELDKKEEQK